MLRLIFLSIITIIIKGLLQNSSKYVSFSYNNVAFQIPTWTIIIAIFIISFVQFWLFKSAINNWLNYKKINKSLKYAKKAFFYLMTGQTSIAENLALKIKDQSACGWLGLLLATNAAKQQAAWENAHKYLTKAEILAEQQVRFIQDSNEIATLGIIKADLYYCQREYQQCILELKKLLKKFPKHPTLLIKLTVIYQNMQDWLALIEILPLLKKSKIYSDYDYQQLEINFYKNHLEKIAINHSIEQSTNQTIDNLIDFFKQLPKHLRKNNKLNFIYINYLIKFKNYDLAEKTLKIYLIEKSNEWDPDLIKLYGLIKTDNLQNQIKTAELLLKIHPQDHNILLTLGRLCMQADLIGKAKNYLEKSLAIEENPECYAELGRLSQFMGDKEKSFSCYQKGLLGTTQIVDLDNG